MTASPNSIVIKLGSGILTQPDGLALDAPRIENLVKEISGLKRNGASIVVVSSGAVAAGLPVFGLKERPDDLTSLQACAAVGQSRLMHFYETLFRQYGYNVGQMLLTHEDLEDGDRRENFGNTLKRLLSFDEVIPIINENDSVGVEELKVGDNDVLSSRVARLIKAKLLVLLTSVDGLYDMDEKGTQKIVNEVHDIEEIMHLAKPEKGKFSVGGMISKLDAVKWALDAGVETIIANGHHPERLPDLITGRGICTRFFV